MSQATGSSNSSAQNPNFPDFLDIQPSRTPNNFLEPHLQNTFGARAQEDAIQRYGIAGRVWEAAYALLHYIQPMSSEFEFDPPFISSLDPHPLTMIELGSGSGIVAAAIGGKLPSKDDLIIATDLPEVCPLLRTNLCSGPVLTVRPLAWGNVQHASDISSEFFNKDRRLTHIICSDLVYFPDLLAPLLRSLIHLTSPPFTAPSPRIIISYKIRSLPKETPFWSAFGLWFEFSPLLTRANGQTWERFGSSLFEDTIFVFVAHRKPQSYQWHLPSDDSDLLNGIGAWGTVSQKGDDTFESLLLMAMDDSSLQ